MGRATGCLPEGNFDFLLEVNRSVARRGEKFPESFGQEHGQRGADSGFCKVTGDPFLQLGLNFLEELARVQPFGSLMVI